MLKSIRYYHRDPLLEIFIRITDKRIIILLVEPVKRAKDFLVRIRLFFACAAEGRFIQPGVVEYRSIVIVIEHCPLRF